MRLVNSDLRELGLKLCTCTTARGNQSQSWEWRAMMILSAGDMVPSDDAQPHAPSPQPCCQLPSLLAIAARSVLPVPGIFSLGSDSSKRGPIFTVFHIEWMHCFFLKKKRMHCFKARGLLLSDSLITLHHERMSAAKSFYSLLIARTR